MLDYGYNFMNTNIFIDNESTICIVKNPVFQSKTKHIDIRHHFIRDSYEKRLIQVIKIHTDHNVADLLTKALDVIQIVDFLNVSPIRYALILSPTVYVSYIEQFWSTAKIKTVNNETKMRAKVDGKTIVITESSVRRDLHFDDEDDFNDEYDTPSHTKKVFANMRRQGKYFSGIVTPLFATILIQSQAVEGEGSEQPTESQHTPTTGSSSHVEPIPTVTSSSHPKKTQKHRKTKRKATEISQSIRPTTFVADETVHEERGDSVERVVTTATSLDAEQGSGNINRTQSTAIPNDLFPQGIGSGGSPRRQYTILGDRPTQTRFERLSKQSNDPPLSRVNTLRSGEDSMKLQELMDLCTKLSERVLALENIKMAQDLEITNLKKRVKKLEKKKKSGTPQLKGRLFKVRIESSAEKSLGDQEDASKQGRNEIDQDERISWFQEDAKTQGRYGHDISTAKVTTASVPSDVDVSAVSPIRPVDGSIIDDITLAEILMNIKSSASRSQKDKEVMFKEPSEPTTTSRPQSHIPAKDKGKRIMQEPEKPVKLDEEVRLEREREEEASKATNIAEWDDVQAIIDADYELAAKLQAEEQGEISIEERSRLFMEHMDKRKKHFAKLKAEEQRRKPPTKTQKRNIMSTYLKNMAGYKHTQLKNTSFEEIHMLFEKEMKRVNIFVDMDAELVKGKETREESSSKRAGDELKQESYKRQKVDDDDKEREYLKQCFEIILDEEFVVHDIPLAVKPAPIGDLKVMFEPDVEDNIWRNLQRQKILLWKLYDSCGIHFMRFENMHIYMLVEKIYPLSPTTITDMLNRKLQADYWNETCYQLLKLITKQLKNP
ncbi:hypothetical protein Tco_0708109 [Tanacetum coccineum]